MAKGAGGSQARGSPEVGGTALKMLAQPMGSSAGGGGGQSLSDQS